MSKFFTEKETEDFLEEETRKLMLPDGSEESVTTFNVVWGAFDSMEETNAFTNKQIINWTFDWYMKDQKYDFTTYFRNFVGFAFEHVKKQRYG